MKKIVFVLAVLLFVLKLFSQAPTNPTHSKDYYLKKSKVDKIAAWVLLGGGATCIITSFAIPHGETFPESGFGIYRHEKDNVKVTYGVIGAISTISSFVFFAASNRNKRKADAIIINFNNQRILLPQQNAFAFKTQPSLTLKIRL